MKHDPGCVWGATGYPPGICSCSAALDMRSADPNEPNEVWRGEWVRINRFGVIEPTADRRNNRRRPAAAAPSLRELQH